jgi:hypothetical protein
MKLREFRTVEVPSGIITVQKDAKRRRASYSVSFFINGRTVKTTCPNRTMAKSEIIRLLKLYGGMRISQILKI